MLIHTASNRRARTAIGALAAIGVMAPAAALAAAPTPTLVPGNPTCADINPAWSEVKIDNDPTAGAHNFGDGTISGTATIDLGRQYVDFNVAPAVDAVIVKASDAANVYSYDPAATSGTGLHGPINPNTGTPYQISHINFCYGPHTPPAGGGDGGTDGGTTPTPTPTPAPAATTPPAGAVDSTSTGEIHVKDTVVVSGASRLSGPASCARRAFTVKISGRRIASVRFAIDGRTVKTGRHLSLRVNPARYGSGVHHLTARVRYAAASQTPSRTHRLVFERCARQVVQPRFAG